jgi:hypothetical protein
MYHDHDHDFYQLLLLLAAASLLLSLACTAAQAVYATLMYKTVRVLRDHWFARAVFSPTGAKTILVLAAGAEDFADAKSHVLWTRYYGLTAIQLRAWARSAFQCAFWLMLTALVCCF